jgi:hypothetical protein
VAHGVLDEVAGDAFEQHRVAARRGGCGVDLDAQAAVPGLRAHRGERRHHDVGQIDRAHLGELGAFGAGEQQQARDEVVGAAGGRSHDRRHPAQLVGVDLGIGQGDVHLGAQHRQRGAQLVAGVGDEAALRVEGRLQPVEHRVETRGQLGDLAAGVTQAGARVQGLGGEAPRRGRDGVQRAEDPPDEHPGHHRGRSDDQRERDQTRPQHVGAGRGADGIVELLRRHADVSDADRGARRQRRHAARHPTDEQPSQPQQQHADERDDRCADEGEPRPEPEPAAPVRHPRRLRWRRRGRDRLVGRPARGAGRGRRGLGHDRVPPPPIRPRALGSRRRPRSR